MKKLTDKQERFSQCVLTEKDNSAAYRAVYDCSKMKPATINRKAAELTSLEHVAARINELKAERSKRTGIDADYVLRQSVKLHERCMQEITPKTYSDGSPILDDNGSPVFEFNAAGAAKALELVGKNVGVQAFKEKIEHSGALEIETISDAELDERIAQLINK